MITLGTPHKRLECFDNDLEFGCLNYVNQKYPGAYLSDELFYTSVGGNVQINSPIIHTYLPPMGDGLVPLECVHLERAKQITIDNAHHFLDSPYFSWYGNKNIITKWLPDLNENTLEKVNKN